MTLGPPHPAVPWAPPASPAVGRGVLDCCLRGNDTGGRRKDTGGGCKEAWTAAYAGMTPAGFLLTQESHCGPLTRPPWTAGHPLPPGERRTGFLLMHEGHCGPLTRRCLGHRRPLPRWGEAYWTAAYAGMTRGAVQRSLDCCLRRNDTVAPSPGGAFGTAGLSRGGERRTGLLLAQEGHGGRCKEAWVPACAGRTPSPACAGMTLWPPHPAVPWAPPASPAGGEAYWTAACAGMTLGALCVIPAPLVCHSHRPCVSFPRKRESSW
jgi:hypothetical protein